MDNDLRIPSGIPDDFVPTPPEGLSDREAEERLASGLGNQAAADPGKTVPQIIAANLFTLFNLLNAVLGLCLALVGAYRNMLFLGVVISNTLIGTVQELRARRTIRRLQLLNIPSVRVMRGGKETRLSAEQLVRGDLVILEAGNQVPADAIVRGGGGAANESLLTGESDAMTKREGDWLMSGSYISEGRLTAQLVHVGQESYINRLSGAARLIRRPQSHLMTDLSRLIRIVSCLLLALGPMLLCKQLFINHAPLTTAVPTAAAAMIGMIPEGLMLLTSMALTVGVIKLGRRKTLVQELYGIETLARADVLCLDKTGTITTGNMSLEGFDSLPGFDDAEIRSAVSRFLGAFDASSGTLDALRRAFPPAQETASAVLPFSSARKCSAASFGDETLVLGAPNFVLPRDAFPPALRQLAEHSAAQGRRVLLLASCRGAIRDSAIPGTPTPMALLYLSDDIRPNARETLAYFRSQGVSVRIISGDDPVTVSAIAKRIGLEGAERYIDASTLPTDEALRDACERYVVFGRVTPDQKRRLVEALKAAGHSVAMTGDGVNDIPALKAADCSIAMAGGSDAAKHAAQLTLLDPDFSSLPAVVAEGRRVVNNITRAASLFLVKTLYSFALSLLLLLLPAAYPFQPIQLTLISTLTIGTPSFFLALEPNADPIRGNFLRSVLQRALPAAFAVAVCAASAMMLERAAGWPMAVCSTIATVSAGAMGLFALARVCLPFSPLRAAVLAAMTLGMALAMTLLGGVFYLTPLDGTQALAALLLAALGLALMLCAEALLHRLQKRPAAHHAA